MTAHRARPDVPVERLSVTACEIPTDAPESDGTHEWQSTTIVIVELAGGGATGLGYSYTHAAAARLAAGPNAAFRE
ncbi:MAG: hypothetical protein KY476_07220 [Planctomycetes bacterium]|nr:hypothetical protein [Planctomycetota bacterium]